MKRKKYRDLVQVPGEPDSAFSIGEAQKIQDQIFIAIFTHFASQGPRHHLGAAAEALAALSATVACFIEFFEGDEQRERLEHFVQTAVTTCREKHDWNKDINIGLFDLVCRGDITFTPEGKIKQTEEGKRARVAQKPAQRIADDSQNVH